MLRSLKLARKCFVNHIFKKIWFKNVSKILQNKNTLDENLANNTKLD